MVRSFSLVRAEPTMDRTRRAASTILRRRARLFRLARAGYRKIAAHDQVLSAVAEDVRTMLRLAYCWARHDYRALPWRSMLAVVSALLYFVNPVDLIPDAVLGAGFVDDISVLSAVAGALHRDLARFRNWEATALRSDTPGVLSDDSR